MYNFFNCKLQEILVPKDLVVDGENQAIVFVHKRPDISEYDISEFDRIFISLKRKKYNFSVKKESEPL
jgi:hypothetical protein